VLGGVLAGPREDRLRRVGDDVRLHAVHGLLDARLLLGLEKRMVVERVLDLVLVERHRGLELLVALLQLEMILNDLREERRSLNRHRAFPPAWGRNRGSVSRFREGLLRGG
jgi:hypothetical protein